MTFVLRLYFFSALSFKALRIGMILDDLVPPTVRHHETDRDLHVSVSEARLLGSRVVTKRRREFITGRYCAHSAMNQLGKTQHEVLIGDCGEPIWPVGLVGSITHCAGYRAAAVAESEDVYTVGIDAEPNIPMPERTLELIATPGDRAHLKRIAAPPTCWDRLLFSAKEAVYKAWYQRTSTWLDFYDAEIRFVGAGAFVARISARPPAVDPRLRDVTGRWALSRGLLVTAVTVLAG